MHALPGIASCCGRLRDYLQRRAAAGGFRRAGAYAAKIVRGANPGDLPIEQASKFWLVVNLKTAKQLGLAVPANLLTLADEVIE